MIRIPYDNVVHDIDLEQLTAPNEIACDFDVSFRWTRVATGMIMGKNNSRGACNYRQPEYLTRMHQHGIHRSRGNKVVTFDLSTCVQNQNHQAFRMLGDVQIPIFRRPFRRVAQLKLVGCRAFPQ
jgi:hypothetical protein